MLRDPHRLLDHIPEDARVLDIGGAEEVFPRADCVIDILPYSARRPGPLDIPERFGPDDWYVGDVCHDAVWSRFGDRSFDFVICSHVLEDVRDPIALCRQMVRVGRAGYIETPSRFRECAKAMPDDLTAGWEHHRWIVDLADDTLIFTAKNPLFHHFDCIPDDRRDHLQLPHLSSTAMYWEGSFGYMERSHKGSTWEIENAFDFYERFDYNTPESDPPVVKDAPPSRCTFQWITDFKLPLETRLSADEVHARYDARLPNALRYGRSPRPYREQQAGLLTRVLRLLLGADRR